MSVFSTSALTFNITIPLSNKDEEETKPNQTRQITHHDASSDTSSIPLCSMGLNLRVSGKGTLAVEEKNTNV